jgi:hypothetical protein
LCCLLLVVAITLGCSGSQPTGPGNDSKAAEDLLAQVREAVRAAGEPFAYQKALEVLNNHLASHPKALPRYQPGAKDRPFLLKGLGLAPDAGGPSEAALRKKFLSEFVGLREDELREVEASRFSPLDAHYLDFCCLLRDAARSLRLTERTGLGATKSRVTRLAQARRAFDWVIRQVNLREPQPELAPAEFVLHQGHGGARERALIFLTLLRQADLDGCLIAYPGKDGPVYWLAGALITDKQGSDVYLFDPRLGLPVPGPEGGIATLAQLRSEPALVKKLDEPPDRYDVTPEQAAKAEVYLALPLSALSPRIRLLEDVLGTHDRVSLAVRPERLLDRFMRAKVGPVKVWNERGQPSNPAPRTPTRVLRESLPAEQGGVDTRERYNRYQAKLVPWFPIEQALREMKTEEKLARIGALIIRRAVAELYQLYVQTPRDQIQRGRFEEAGRRLARLEKAMGEYEASQPDEAAFAVLMDEVGKRMTRAAQEGGEQKIQDVLLGEDQVFQILRFPNDPEVDRTKLHRGFLGTLVFRAAGETLKRDLNYLKALRWQEKAERHQARVDQLAAGRTEGAAELRQDTADAWGNAKEAWGEFGREFTPGAIAARTARARALRQQGEGDTAIGLLDYLFRELRRSLAAGTLGARALEGGGRIPQAVKALHALVKDVGTVVESKELQTLRSDITERAPPEARATLDTALFGDLQPTGTLRWLAYRARLEIRRLSPK